MTKLREIQSHIRLGWGFIVDSSQKPHFSQRTREMGHPAFFLRKKQNFLDDLSNSGWQFDYVVKAGQTARPRHRNCLQRNEHPTK